MSAVDKFHRYRHRRFARPQRARATGRWLRSTSMAGGICLGFLTAPSASLDTIGVCADALNPEDMISACTEIVASRWSNNRQVMFALNNRANAHESLGNHNAAIHDYSRALGVDPHYENARYNRGTTYLNMGKLDLAIADFDDVLKINLRRADAYHNRGLARLRLGDNAAAIADFINALEIDPTLAFAHNNLGVARKRMTDHARALAKFSRAIELMPTYANALNNRGEVYLIERSALRLALAGFYQSSGQRCAVGHATSNGGSTNQLRLRRLPCPSLLLARAGSLLR